MLRYLLILLLINTYGRSLGTPVLDRNSNGKIMIGKLLSDLTKQCKNEFVSSQIANKLEECNVTAPPIYDVELQCLVFYDASRLLCNISTASFPNLATDFEVKTSGKLTADEFCSEASHFKLLPTVFQTLLSQVFHSDTACKKVCTDKDVLSGDTNFVCKYYKWSMGILQSPLNTVVSSSTDKNASVISGAENDSKISESVIANANDTSGVQVKDPEQTINETSSLSSIKAQNDQLQSNLESSSKALSTSGFNQQTTNQTKTLLEPAQLEDNEKPVESEKPTAHDKDNVESGGNVDILNQEIPVNVNNVNGGANANVIDHPDAGDIGDSERDDGELGDDDNDPDGADLDVRNSQQAPNTQLHLSGESSQKDFLPSISDGYTEDDDHFFPFFLTAVIIVIVLYVLYHNKNKVSKMFFGLIVEGRQPGRRRNSRGHSYRRLDTLEQAMSANAPAPPSKIIY